MLTYGDRLSLNRFTSCGRASGWPSALIPAILVAIGRLKSSLQNVWKNDRRLEMMAVQVTGLKRDCGGVISDAGRNGDDVNEKPTALCVRVALASLAILVVVCAMPEMPAHEINIMANLKCTIYISSVKNDAGPAARSRSASEQASAMHVISPSSRNAIRHSIKILKSNNIKDVLYNNLV